MMNDLMPAIRDADSSATEKNSGREARARQLWHMLKTTEPTPELPLDATLAERIVYGARHMTRQGPEPLREALEVFALGLPAPFADLSPLEDKTDVPMSGFTVSGKPLPGVATQRYFNVECFEGEATKLVAKTPQPTPCIALLLMGRVHFRYGIPVRVRFGTSDGKVGFELGLGSDWITVLPEFRAFSIEPGRDLVFLVTAGDGRFVVSCNGIEVAAGPLPVSAPWTDISIEVAPRLSYYADLMLYRATAWALGAADTKKAVAALAEPGSAIADALAAADDIGPLALLLSSNDALRLADDAALSADLAKKAHTLAAASRDDLAGAICDRLPATTAAQLRADVQKIVGPTIVEVKDLVVELENNPSLERRLTRRLSGKREVFRVVDGVNFAVHRGDVLGIIGHNGAGKSTLLRALCGLIRIKEGRINIANRFLLLRPGIGMREELTGRENITSMGFYLGLELDEIEALTDDIVSFSELGAHIDKSVKYYSDGMRARLSFSIATSFAPDVVFLDELLGAGDISFQEKAQQRLRNFIDRAGTVVVVTHSMAFVRESCTKALLMHQGRQVMFGDPHEAVARYLMLMER